MKKVYFIPLVVIGSILVWLGLQSQPENLTTYHITLADPKQYVHSIFSDVIKIQKGSYQFSFVPNGDSPQTLSIVLNGINFSFAQDYKLNGTLHKTGISDYYTWDYSGNKIIDIPLDQDLRITINPHGDTLGSVSVFLKKT